MPRTAPPKPFLRRVLFNTAPMDAFVLLAAGFWVIRLWAAPNSADRTQALLIYGGAAVTLVVAWLAMRSGLLYGHRGRSMVFRLTLFAAIDVPFMFGLRAALAALQPELLDTQLIAIDEMLFGNVPAVMLEPYVHPYLVEWLAFFYFNYFALVAAAILPGLIKGRDRVRMERLFGILFIMVLGNIVYTVVPGLGPYAAITFETHLEGGPFWGVVKEMVRLLGPQLDIFPSLHTAVPVFLAIHTFRNRSSRMLRWLAWPLLFVTAQIVAATLYLRWHYAIDVVAGIVLAVVGVAVAGWAQRVEDRRVAEGRQETFGRPLGEDAGE